MLLPARGGEGVSFHTLSFVFRGFLIWVSYIIRSLKPTETKHLNLFMDDQRMTKVFWSVGRSQIDELKAITRSSM